MKLRGNRIPGRSGTLYQRTKKKRLKTGKIVEYPLVEGSRNPDNVRHWFWQLTWKEKTDDSPFADFGREKGIKAITEKG